MPCLSVRRRLASASPPDDPEEAEAEEAEEPNEEEGEADQEDTMSVKGSEYATASPSEKRGQIADLDHSPVAFSWAPHEHRKRKREDDDPPAGVA